MLKYCNFILAVGFVQMLQAQFVQGKHTQLYLEDSPYRFSGTNLWYAMNLGASDNQKGRERLAKELDRLKNIGISNLRIMAASEGPDTEPWRVVPAMQTSPQKYNEQLLEGLDYVLDQVAKRDMKVVLCLNNMWPWTGGFAQYVSWVTGESIPYPPPAKNGNWLKFIKFSSRFFVLEKAQEIYKTHLSTVVLRKNTINGKLYKEDPTIMAWQLANEPRGFLNKKAYYHWVESTSGYIKSLDTNHLVSVGSEGNAVFPKSNKARIEHAYKNIDYVTAHIWAQNWRWYTPEAHQEKALRKAIKKAKRYLLSHVKIAQSLHKPFVLDEFGLARDSGSYSSESTTEYRDRYFKEVLGVLVAQIKQNKASGFNFWAWAGEGRPRHPKSVWKPGDAFTGDPPFEHQGWYSVYDTDTSTIEVLKEIAKQINP